MKRLLIDLGSTNIKYRLLEGENVSSHGSVPFPSPCLEDGIRFEVPLGKILDAVGKILTENAADELFLSVQMHGFILADRESRALTEYISWRDKRGKDYCFQAVIPKDSGESAKPNLPFLSLRSIREKNAELYEKAAHFFTLGSYLSFFLTGKNVAHITDVAASGFYNVRERSLQDSPYHVRVPEASYRVLPIGNYRGACVFTPCGDQQCAVLGAGVREDEYVLNLGTAAQLCCPAEGYVEGDFESRPYFGGNTLCSVTGLIGGGEMLRFSGDEETLTGRLYENYAAAMTRLPRRGGLLITGGVVGYRRETLCRVAERLKLPYRFHEGTDALEGLEKLSKEQER